MPQVTTIGSAAALTSALATAQSGDTILLQPGTYSGLSLSNLNFGAGITISSADPAHQAVFTNFNIRGGQGLTFSHLDFKVLTPNWTGYNFYSSQHITFDQVHVYGPSGAPDPDVQAVNFFDSSYLTFTNSEVDHVSHGVSFARSDHIVVSGNNIHDVNSDTLDFTQDANVLVTGNALHDFYPTNGNHPDAIQFGTFGSTVASHDITISDNLIYRGAGENSQGVFMRDEVGTLPLQDVTITNNTILGTGSSAIRLMHTDDVTATGNTLVTFAGGDPTTFLIQNSDHITAANNTSSSLSITSANGNTNIGQTNNVGDAAAVSDDGAAVIQQWLATHAVGPLGQAPVATPMPALIPMPTTPLSGFGDGGPGHVHIPIMSTFPAFEF